jgi:hypothetical protein
MLSKEELKKKEQDHNIQFVVLLQLIIEKIEFLETQGYTYGAVKSFLNNAKVKFESFMYKAFKIQDIVDGQTAKDATNKLMVMQERVEKALLNEYILTVDERKERALEVLGSYLIKPMAEKALQEMEEKNLFNF